MRSLTTLALLLAPLVATAALDRQQAIERALHDANAALVAAYEKDGKRKDAVHPEHKGPWANAKDAEASAIKGGWRVTWKHFAPKGFEFECILTVADDGSIKIDKVWATFSPD